MSDLPSSALHPTGFSDFGIDANGESAFFGFKLKDGSLVQFAVSHVGLAEAVKYLQNIAALAQERRLAANPHAADMEAQQKPYSPLVSLEFLPDISGQTVVLNGTTQSGVPQTFQLPFDLVSQLHTSLPSLIAEMKNRQQQAKSSH